LLELVRRCTPVDMGGPFPQWLHWCTVGLVWYLALRVYGEAVALALRGAGSGRVLTPRDPHGLIRRFAGWELVALLVIGTCVLAATHGCNQCVHFGHHASCEPEIGSDVVSMMLGIWVLRCLRVTGYSFAPTAEWM
jgi:hypothetical protein